MNTSIFLNHCYYSIPISINLFCWSIIIHLLNFLTVFLFKITLSAFFVPLLLTSVCIACRSNSISSNTIWGFLNHWIYFTKYSVLSWITIEVCEYDPITSWKPIDFELKYSNIFRLIDRLNNSFTLSVHINYLRIRCIIISRMMFWYNWILLYTPCIYNSYSCIYNWIFLDI